MSARQTALDTRDVSFSIRFDHSTPFPNRRKKPTAVLRSRKHRKPISITAGWREDFAKFKAERQKVQEPIEAKVLGAILGSSNTPYSSYVAAPRGVLHGVHACVKQAWLVVILVVTARSQAPYAIAGGIALLSVVALPPRLWTAQLKRLGLLCLFLFVTTAIFADGVPPVTQTQHLPSDMEGLPPLTPTGSNHRHVLFHLFFVTVTRRSLQLAVSTSCLTFATLQGASLCLTTTPAEQLALGLGIWLKPLSFIGVPTAEISLTLLLSLRFLAVVFEEVSMRMLGKMFSNLVRQSENIALAMRARGFVGPKKHTLMTGSHQETGLLPNAVALLMLGWLVSTSAPR